MPKGEIRLASAPAAASGRPGLATTAEQVAWLPSQLQLIVVGLGPVRIRSVLVWPLPGPWPLASGTHGRRSDPGRRSGRACFAGTVCVLSDARRGNLYASAFSFAANGTDIRSKHALRPEPFLWKVWWGGSITGQAGLALGRRGKNLFTAVAGRTEGSFPGRPGRGRCARWLALGPLGWDKWQRKAATSLRHVNPITCVKWKQKSAWWRGGGPA